MIKLIIFDWDDVFTIGSKKGYFACYHQALLDVGVKLTPEEEHKRILAKWGTTHREELEELLKEHPELVDAACKSYERELFSDKFSGELSVIPGTADMLKRLHEKYILCVATGVHPSLLRERIIPKFGIPPVFSDIVSSY